MEKSGWKINPEYDENNRVDYDKFCSICLSKDSQALKSKGPLITPCLCVGKRSHQHKRCIENWIEQTGVAGCPFCFVRYEYSKERKSFWSYLEACQLENELVYSSMTYLFAIYLFIVGLSVCDHYIGQIAFHHEWFPLILFCFVCTGTVLLFVGIVSLCLDTMLRHHLRYSLWKTSQFKINLKAYEI